MAFKTELELANESGFLKTPEQQEAVEQQSFDEGYKACECEALAGLLKKEGIYNSRQMIEFIEMYKEEMKAAMMDIKGTYRLGSGRVETERLYNQIIKETDERFPRIATQDQDGE